MNERKLMISLKIRTIEDRDAVIAALQPLTAQGWEIEMMYGFHNEDFIRWVKLGDHNSMVFS